MLLLLAADPIIRQKRHMAEIINLRQARKRKQRAAAADQAAANRIAYGRSGEERRQSEAERQRQERRLDGVKREPEPPPS